VKRYYCLVFSLFLYLAAGAQTPDTTGIYGERRDTMKAAVFTSTQDGSYLSRSKEIRTEVISAAGLCKMACCNLAESFENSASVTVGYSDAITGARQIRLLGQSGIYTQMLDENRPVMRGLSAPWGLNYVPGQWLESIQIAKGVTSVINGVESMTGQINMEHRKPTDEKPLYLQASFMSDTRADLNVVSSLQLDPMSKWSTVILAHADGNFKTMDGNSDGFMDDPLSRNFSLSNRWLYFGSDGVQVRFGVRGIYDKRSGGQMNSDGWRSEIGSKSLGAYVKAGFPLNEDNSRNVAAILDYTLQGLDSQFGLRRYDAAQHSAFINLLLQDQSIEQHHLTLGLSNMLDIYDEDFAVPGGTLGPAASSNAKSRLNDLGVFGEYTFHTADETTFSAIVGLRADWYNFSVVKVSPRLTLKYEPWEQLVLRANGGRGIRYSTPLLDNIGVLSTSKVLLGDLMQHPLEDSWTFGGNATWYLPALKNLKASLSLDYFHTLFTEQMIVDYTGSNSIMFHLLSSIDGGKSYTNNVQLDFTITPLRGLSLTLTGRYTDARQTLLGCQADNLTTDPGSQVAGSGRPAEKPMISRYKGVFNVQYATRLNKWIFDFTASLNGPCRVWDFMKTLPEYASGYTSVYPLLYAQVTKRFKGFDIYVGGENLTNYKQENPIINASDPFSTGFDASQVWGPLMGIKIYCGVRLTIWKTE